MAPDGNIRKRVEDWLKGIEMDIEIGEQDIDDFQDYLESELRDAENTSATNPSEAYGKVVRLASVTSHAARKKPLLVSVLNRYVQRFVNVMGNVKKALGAESFTITVSFPFDLSISLTF